MPELPEVETVRRGLVAHMEGRVIRSVKLARADL
ncbi:MAG: DNA-formamidopyrimidine glycosylase family protein, partial [Pseudomonadota bacterium]|nr:DNA-formamidopyrimidine glycosylase family protein [Pseudomonadota bacterium]